MSCHKPLGGISPSNYSAWNERCIFSLANWSVVEVANRNIAPITAANRLPGQNQSFLAGLCGTHTPRLQALLLTPKWDL
ncbi:hypothetical protein CDV31_017345 [Fusarium ambrosium]|uniref:Uncharacterized protein n=1 Tax=Fusarium ambrosium TaxID=131363 RepID=A0A428RHW7_9HYPO|nr:hypothetical protein CDV31_017345 [Fusarium ambrosium]